MRCNTDCLFLFRPHRSKEECHTGRAPSQNLVCRGDMLFVFQSPSTGSEHKTVYMADCSGLPAHSLAAQVGCLRMCPQLCRAILFHKLPRLPSSQYTYAPCRARRILTLAHPTYQDDTCFQTVSQLYSASGTFMQDLPDPHRCLHHNSSQLGTHGIMHLARPCQKMQQSQRRWNLLHRMLEKTIVGKSHDFIPESKRAAAPSLQQPRPRRERKCCIA